ncbi:MAG: glyoxalase [Lachnospiraceae bacterium]|nr:glyoxalase [Lachnospiraceae bacterium]
MGSYSDLCLDTFLALQGRLFDEPVAETREDAEAFLMDCMAQVVPKISDVRNWLDESGMDVTGMSDDELAEQAEVFPLPDGTWLIVEG